MCFGNQTTTSTMTPTANPAVSAAATSDLANSASTLSNPSLGIGQQYSGQLTAPLAPAQQQTIDATQGIANNGTGTTASNMIGGYASAPAQSVSSNSIASNMSPYMNQYVMQALAPQLQQMQTANAATNNATDAQATGSGAYGDARTGIQQANNSFNQNVAQEGLIGNAYNSAFNTAIGAGAQDSANQLSAANANAGYNETALNRSLGGATALEGLQTQQQGVQGAANTAAQQDTAQSQASLTAQYNNWLQAQQSAVAGQTSAAQTLGAASGAMPASTVSTNQTPNNSGWALAGALGGALLAPVTGGLSLAPAIGSAIGGSVGPSSIGGPSGPTPLVSDAREKDDINLIGGLHDGTPVYSYHYRRDPHQRKQIGLMAQDVKNRRPDAVITLPDEQGTMMVDYAKATEASRLMSMAI